MDNIRGKLPFRSKSCRSAGYSFKAVVKRLRESSIRGMSNIHESTVINTQQRKSTSETEEVRRNPIRKALMPQ
ncbi:hypothetical protein GCK72_012210 [Caenorhabditis remanei]|uniref:Uncharacterized protein n=1 Tax=Caenorhabditis remanei TaxID=31234 RepID=A0A6A5GKF0_CAERE|nr:hypothetical protein GCK72_012210 [Caenorhabditis remanei]KAF1755760.1 hypothetical protein GCK72_012210 [Caenorhabditis remanei]